MCRQHRQIVDYDLEIELKSSSRRMAEWSGAPVLPPREVGGAGSDPRGGENIFCLKCDHPGALCIGKKATKNTAPHIIDHIKAVRF